MGICAIVYNPVSGRKKFESALPRVIERLERKGFTCNIYRTEYAGHATTLVQEILKDSIDLLIISGGDGTFNEAVNGLMQFESLPMVGYIPTGTSCDVGKTLGLSKNIFKALSVIEAGVSVHMDVVWSNYGYFTYVSAIGSYIDISYTTPSRWKRLLGYPAYLLMGVKSFFTIPKIPMRINADGVAFEDNYALAIILNSRRVASFTLMKKPYLDDGKVDVLLYRYTPFVNNFLFLFSFMFGRKTLPRMQWLKVNKASFEPKSHRPWNQDGEKSNTGTLHIQVMAKRLPIIIQSKRKKYFPNQ